MRLSQYRRIFLAVICLLVLLTVFSSAYAADNSRISTGILDITQWDFNVDGNISLDGEWEFYWNKLLNHRDLYEAESNLYADVPHTWNAYSKNGEGYATYRLHVKTNLSKETMLAFRIDTFSSAYNLYIDDKLVASNGNVSTTALEEVGEYKPQAVVFSVPASEFDIIIQVSNFHYARGGFWYSMSLGSVKGILNLHDSIIGKETFLIGVLLIVSLFYFCMYILQNELKYALYFAVFCIFMIFTLDMVGQFFILRFLPGLSFNFIIFLWHTSINGALVFLTLFIHELFKSKVSSLITKAFITISIIGQLISIFITPVIYTRFGYLCNYFEALGILCTVIIVAVGIKKGCKGGWLNIIAMIILLITYIHNTLYRTNVIRSDFGEIFFLGLFLFIFIQMIIQGQRIKMFHEHKIAAELSFLQAQIKPHFLYNVMNTFVSVSRYDIEKARNLLINYSNYLRRSFDFKDISQYVPLENEIEFARVYAEIEKARFEERVEVTFDVPEDLEIWVPTLILQPLIENAILHGILQRPEGGQVELSIKRKDKMLNFRLKDNGIGMDEKKKYEVLNQENGKGVGILNIDNRLRRLYGKGLDIKSNPTIGTEITWSVPIKRYKG